MAASCGVSVSFGLSTINPIMHISDAE